MNRIMLAAGTVLVTATVLTGCAVSAPTSTASTSTVPDADRPGRSAVATNGERPREWSTIAGVHVTTDDGWFAESAPITDLVGTPAIDQLDPALRDAVTDASDAAAAEGHPFVINSAWRSKHLQRALLAKGVEDHGSAEAAAKWVATPEESTHVQGSAVDVGDVDGMTWMSENGNRFGLCQTYANELWHYELTVAPGATCPPPIADASVR